MRHPRPMLLLIALCCTTYVATCRDVIAQEQDLPWAVKLGARAYQVECAFPIISRVVLVPDGATYLDELNKWSPAGRWPVLFEDDQLAPMFIRRFQPKEIVRRNSSRRKSQDSQETGDATAWRPERDVLNAAVIRAWGGDPTQHAVGDAFAAMSFEPAGVVVTSVNDLAWTGAVALAAGRGQPLLWLDGEFGAPDDILNHDAAMGLIDAVDALVDETGHAHDALGDTIDAISICRSVGGSAQLDSSVVSTDPRLPHQHAEGPRAITDLIGRTDFAERYAFTGWIFGDEARCAYTAMCSLFLDRTQATLIHTYPDAEQWNRYHVRPAAAMFETRGMAMTQLSGEQTGSAAWIRKLPGGVTTDLVIMNTKGGTGYFDLFDQRATPHDVPVLNTPSAVHLVHSWSLRYVERADSVGAVWLDRGAYAMIGSVHEPYLGAFAPPSMLAQRLMGYVPLLVAARWWDGEGPFADPWRINTIGDPLMTCPPVDAADTNDPTVPVLRDADQRPLVRRRIDMPAGYGVNLLRTMPDRMRAAASDETGDILASGISDLILIDRDDLAMQMWTMASERGLAESTLAAAGSAVLPAIYRARDVDSFVDAFTLIDAASDRDRTMLWHLLGPRIGKQDITANQLRLLAEHPRRPQPHLDLDRIAHLVRNRLGKEVLRARIEQEISQARSNRERDQLQKLLADLNG